MEIDSTIKQVVVDVITRRLETYKGDKFKRVEKTIPLYNTDLASITEAFEQAYNTPGYVEGSAYVCSDSESSVFDTQEYIYFEIEVETTEQERQAQVVKRINKGLHFKMIYDKLTELGYKRTGFNSGKLKVYDDTTIHDMYVNDQDRLASYYMLFFNKD